MLKNIYKFYENKKPPTFHVGGIFLLRNIKKTTKIKYINMCNFIVFLLSLLFKILNLLIKCVLFLNINMLHFI